MFFPLEKKIAKLLRNKNYSIILLDKEKSDLIEIGNNHNIESKKLNCDQNKAFLDNIPEVSTDDEYSFNRFDNNDLSKEGAISFTIEALYKNINLHTNMKYIENKIYQEKTLKYITKLIENKTRISSTDNNNNNNISVFSSQSGISKSLSIKSSNISNIPENKELKINPIHSNKILSFQKLDDILKLSNNDSQENIVFQSERIHEPEEQQIKHNKTKNSDKKVYSIGS